FFLKKINGGGQALSSSPKFPLEGWSFHFFYYESSCRSNASAWGLFCYVSSPVPMGGQYLYSILYDLISVV
ncbi:MAG TPA: hypothetical protein DEF88_14415, partial [Porphyromonadaceae bacterium]|nr:hypothetical protein [Porphyromonadaceae bacterium]